MSHPSQYGPPPQQQAPTKKPIYKRVWFWLLALVVLVIAISALSGGDGDAPRATPSSGQAIESPAPAEEPAPAEDDPLTDDDWTITEIQLNDSSGFGTEITARVTNNADSTRTSILTLTIFKDGKMVTSTDGVATDVEAGSTATVTFIGAMDDELPADGNYTYELQANF